MTAGAGFERDELTRLEGLFAEALRLHAPARRGPGWKGSIVLALAEACGICRARGLPPERVIIMLKETWWRLRNAYLTADEAQEALEHAVTACIEQYFAEESAPTESRAAARR